MSSCQDHQQFENPLECRMTCAEKKARLLTSLGANVRSRFYKKPSPKMEFILATPDLILTGSHGLVSLEESACPDTQAGLSRKFKWLEEETNQIKYLLWLRHSDWLARAYQAYKDMASCPKCPYPFELILDSLGKAQVEIERVRSLLLPNPDLNQRLDRLLETHDRARRVAKNLKDFYSNELFDLFHELWELEDWLLDE